MVRTTFLVLATLLGLAAAATVTAQAHVNVDINLGYGGVPGYLKYSCARGAHIIFHRGFYDVLRKDCQGKQYQYTAYRGLRKFWITFNSHTGVITSVRQINR